MSRDHVQSDGGSRGRTGYMRRFYGTFAGWYDRLVDLLYRKKDREWRRAAIGRLSPDDEVLEVGAGTGRTEALGVDARRYVSLDVTRRMLATGDASTPVEGDVHALPFPSDSFDAVLAVLLMSTRIDQHAALGEMARVCRPGGRIVVVDKFRSESRPMQLLDRALTALTAPFAFDFGVPVEQLAAARGLRVRERTAVPENLGTIEMTILENPCD